MYDVQLAEVRTSLKPTGVGWAQELVVGRGSYGADLRRAEVRGDRIGKPASENRGSGVSGGGE